jgi:hypothetical protein
MFRAHAVDERPPLLKQRLEARMVESHLDRHDGRACKLAVHDLLADFTTAPDDGRTLFGLQFTEELAGALYFRLLVLRFGRRDEAFLAQNVRRCTHLVQFGLDLVCAVSQTTGGRFGIVSECGMAVGHGYCEFFIRAHLLSLVGFPLLGDLDEIGLKSGYLFTWKEAAIRHESAPMQPTTKDQLSAGNVNGRSKARVLMPKVKTSPWDAT